MISQTFWMVEKRWKEREKKERTNFKVILRYIYAICRRYGSLLSWGRNYDSSDTCPLDVVPSSPRPYFHLAVRARKKVLFIKSSKLCIILVIYESKINLFRMTSWSKFDISVCLNFINLTLQCIQLIWINRWTCPQNQHG